jgi:hypothetical protein
MCYGKRNPLRRIAAADQRGPGPKSHNPIWKISNPCGFMVAFARSAAEGKASGGWTLRSIADRCLSYCIERVP